MIIIFLILLLGGINFGTVLPDFVIDEIDPLFAHVYLDGRFYITWNSFRACGMGRSLESARRREKMVLFMGSIAGNMMAFIVLSEKSAGMENLEVSKFVVDITILYVEYMASYDEDMLTTMIESVDRFYSSPANKFCNPTSLAYLSYLESKGEDITKLLRNLQVYSEFGT